mgnify:CR=1 FL=1
MMKYFIPLLLSICVFACEKDKPQNNTVNDPPSPNLDLTCHFSGVIDGAQIELAQNVSGYTGEAHSSTFIFSSPDFSHVIYRFKLISDQSPLKLEIYHGSVYWDYGVVSSPTLNQFISFHLTNTTPEYKDNGADGFQFTFMDQDGNTWASNPLSFNSQNVLFSDLIAFSNTSGDYVKFKCQFNCYVYNPTLSDSLHVQNAELTGWFMR